jgi:hypothetical protein
MNVRLERYHRSENLSIFKTNLLLGAWYFVPVEEELPEHQRHTSPFVFILEGIDSDTSRRSPDAMARDSKVIATSI